MARDIFGNKVTRKEDRYTRRVATEADVRWEYVKMILWIIAGSAYLYFIFR